MSQQLASTVAMVRAIHCGANPETATSNVFQSTHTEAGAAERAEAEQRLLAASLQEAGVRVLMLDPPAGSRSPDGVFPNNWFSTHADGRLWLYPMEAPSRRTEIIPDLATRLASFGYKVREQLDWTDNASRQRYLEGTGALVLDRHNRRAWVCRSSRADIALAEEWADLQGYSLTVFDARDPEGRAVYHTNVVMSIGEGVAIACLEAIPDAGERERFARQIEASGHELVALRWEQVRRFAGNQLFLGGREGQVVALSASADACLDDGQKAVIDRHAERVVADIATIERHGGGSVRCMLAEIFLPTL